MLYPQKPKTISTIPGMITPNGKLNRENQTLNFKPPRFKAVSTVMIKSITAHFIPSWLSRVALIAAVVVIPCAKHHAVLKKSPCPAM
ncbi:hypothetical protein J6W20_01220 [bacterium]|nr:hypothetical protein [bacterium]